MEDYRQATIITDVKRQKGFVFVLMLTSIVAMLNSTTVTISLPTYMQVFGVDINTVQWVTVGYMLPLGMMMPLSSYLGERYSYKKVFLFGLAAIGVSSLGCACSPTFFILVLCRFIKGAAAGLIVPGAMAMLYRYLPKDCQAHYLGKLVLFQSVGVAIGPSLAGFILQFSNWHVLFLFNIPLVIISYLMGRKYFVSEKGSTAGKIDIAGIIEISVGTGLVMIAFTEGDLWGWTSPLFLSCLAVGMFLIVYFILKQFHTAQPLLNFKVLRYREFAIAFIIQSTLAMTLGITAILQQLYFQTVRGYPPVITGLLVLIPSLILLIGNEVANRLDSVERRRNLLIVSMFIVVIGNLAWCRPGVETSMLLLMTFFSIRYFGMGMMQMPLMDYGMSAVPPNMSGHASSLFNWGRQFIQVVSTNILTVILSLNINRYYQAAGNIGTPPQGSAAYKEVAAHAVGTDFVIMTVFLVMSLICTFFIKAKKAE